MNRTSLALKHGGLQITPESLRGLPPYRTEHLNRLRDYTINNARGTGNQYTR